MAMLAGAVGFYSLLESTAADQERTRPRRRPRHARGDAFQPEGSNRSSRPFR